jgi:hypothetical protein
MSGDASISVQITVPGTRPVMPTSPAIGASPGPSPTAVDLPRSGLDVLPLVALALALLVLGTLMTYYGRHHVRHRRTA